MYGSPSCCHTTCCNDSTRRAWCCPDLIWVKGFLPLSPVQRGMRIEQHRHKAGAQGCNFVHIALRDAVHIAFQVLRPTKSTTNQQFRGYEHKNHAKSAEWSPDRITDPSAIEKIDLNRSHMLSAKLATILSKTRRASSSVFNGLDWHLWGKMGSFLCSSAYFWLKTMSKNCGSFSPAQKFTPPVPKPNCSCYPLKFPC